MPITMLRSAWAQKSMHPTHFHARGVNVQAAHFAQLGQLLVAIISFVLHAGGERHHGQVVGVGDVVDVAGEAERKFRHGDQQGVAAARRRPLHVHGGPAGRLTQAAPHILAPLAQTLH